MNCRDLVELEFLGEWRCEIYEENECGKGIYLWEWVMVVRHVENMLFM